VRIPRFPFPSAAALGLAATLGTLHTTLLNTPLAAQAHVHTPGMSHDSAQAAKRPAPTRAGQEAFATIAEIVRLLDADPKTDWSKVNLEALRQHLIDMDDVTIRSAVQQESVPGGVRFVVTGTGRTRDAIRRMAMAHGTTVSKADGFTWTASEAPDGAQVTVRVTDPTDTRAIARLRGLGFLGVLSLGDHHVVHHLALASGQHPH